MGEEHGKIRTIYQTNIRSAYQQGKWERSQNSDAHPYLMYRVGNSKEHRKEHLAWDGLILPKDDPWWNSHFPPNDWGCRRRTQAISENRAGKLRQNGFDVPPSIEGNDGYHVNTKTAAAQGYRATAAGFVEGNIAAWLKKNAGIETGDSVTIALEARLFNGPKGKRHDATGTMGARTIIDALMYGQVYFDKGNLIYLFPHSAKQLTKITVNPLYSIEGGGSKIRGPGIVNIETLNVTNKDADYIRIIEGLKRIK